MTRYAITRSRSRGDVGLSKRGEWGGMRFLNATAALAWVRAKDAHATIETEDGL